MGDVNIHKFSDFDSGNKSLSGVKKRIDDILGMNIIILKYIIRPSKYEGEYIILQFKFYNSEDDDKYIIMTGSGVLLDQVDRNKHEIPFVAKIVKYQKYYTFE